MHKLFYDVPEGATEITVEGEDFAHLTVLRIKAGETVTVSDGVSRCYTATAESFSKKGAVFSLSDPRPFEVESDVKITAYCALLKSGKSDGVIQKAVELGAAEIVLFQSKNCVAEASSEKGDRKLERWNKISRQAAMQSGRGCIPDVGNAVTFDGALLGLKKADCGFVCYETTPRVPMREIYESTENAPRTAAFLVGPEGGISDREAEKTVQADVALAGLGPRILRTETAPLCVMSALMLMSGNMD